MKSLRHILLAGFFVSVAATAYSQTNTFPASGNVGIGTTTPSSKLQVHGSIYTNSTRTNSVFNGSVGSDNANLIGSEAYWALRTDWSNSYNLDVYNSGNPINALTVNQAGNLGLGINAPAFKLHIKDGPGGGQLRFQRGTGVASIVQDNNQNNLYVDAQAGLFLNSQNTGNVGIGTATPSGRLHVSGTIYSSATRTNAVFAGTIASDHANLVGSEGYWALRSATNNSYNLDVYNGGSPIAAMTVSQAGNLGIGTTSPEYKLHIKDGPGGGQVKFQRGTGVAAISQDTDQNNLYIDAQAGLFFNAQNSASVGIGTNSALGRLQIGGTLYLNATRTNTVFNGNVGIDNANIVGSAGYWAIRTSTNNNYNLDVYNGGSVKTALTIAQNGSVGIGTTAPDASLAVKGQIHAEEVKVDLAVPGPDYVFETDYDLPSLTSIESYIKENKHLPEVPSAKEMETNGVKVGEMEMLLLKKIEELTLYSIEFKKEIEKLKAENQQMLTRIESLTKE